MAYRVVVNLDKLRAKPDCNPECSYPFAKPEQVTGPSFLRQLAGFEIFCRRCDDHPCVTACPFEALEQQPDGKIKRFNMRCTQCNSCMVACPFGTIVPAALLYKDSMCDLCVDPDRVPPLCSKTCDCGAFSWEEVADDAPANDPSLFIVSDRLAVRTKRFIKAEPVPVRKK